MKRSHALILATLVALIVVAHVFLWLSPMATGTKLAYTILNTVAWTVILGPVVLVSRWLTAIERRNAQHDEDGPPT